MRVTVYDNEGKVLFERRREGEYRYVTFPLADTEEAVTLELKESLRVIGTKGSFFKDFAVRKSLKTGIDSLAV
jgi:hypothetical protein